MKKLKKNLPKLIKTDGNTQIQDLSKDNIQTLVNSNQLSSQEGKTYLYFSDRANQISQQVIQYTQQYPNHTLQEIKNFLQNIKPQLTKEEIQEFIKIHTSIINNWDKNFEMIKQQETQEQSLFNNVNIEEETGIVRQMTDPMNRLKELLETAKVKLSNDKFIFEGKIKDSFGSEILLVYELNASSEQDAHNLSEQYKKIMLTKGLKIWMGHWRTANQYLSLTFTCPMIEIMKATSDEERKANFSVGEKQEYWDITKQLAKTELIYEKKINKGKKEKTIWLQQPLLEILGGEKETNESYPDIIVICVFKPQFNIKFFPAIYKNSTLLLHPNDIGLAFYIQTRASQFGKGEKILKLDWPLLFYQSGLTKTAESSQRIAKSRIRKKLEELKQDNIIEEYEEYIGGIIIKPKVQQKSKKSEIT